MTYNVFGGWDVKPYSLTHSLTHSFSAVEGKVSGRTDVRGGNIQIRSMSHQKIPADPSLTTLDYCIRRSASAAPSAVLFVLQQ